MKNFFLQLIVIFLVSGGYSQTNEVRFEHLPLKQDVSNNLTSDILQDRRGFIWFGTAFGLIKYDGYNYTTYRSDNSDSLSISHNSISCIFEARDGNLWIGTNGGGLNRFDPLTERFFHYINNPSDSTGLSNNFVRAIEQDYLGNLWIGTENGLNLLAAENKNNPAKITFKQYPSDLWDITSLSYPVVNTIFEDLNHTLWIGTNNGLNYFKPESDTFGRFFAFDSTATFSLAPELYVIIDSLKSKKGLFGSILEIEDFQNLSKTFRLNKRTKALVIGMGEGYGFFIGKTLDQMSDKGWIENAENGKTIWEMKYKSTSYAGGAQKNRIQAKVITLNPGIYRLRYKSDDSHSVKNWNNHPPDRQDYWGIQIIPLSKREAVNIKNLLNQRSNLHPNSLSSNTITAISQGKDASILWVGTGYGGLNKFDLKKKKFIHYKHHPKKPNTLAGNRVNAIVRESEHLYWIGTNYGLSLFNSEDEKFTNYRHNYYNPHSISSNSVNSVLKDQSGILWLATYWGGIDKLNTKKDQFPQLNIFDSHEKDKSINNILAVYGDKTGALWLGTSGSGLIKYNLATKSFKKFTHDKNNRHSLSYNYIKTIAEADSNHLWVGTYGGGLNKLNVNTGECIHYYYDNNDPHSLSDERILSFLQDKKGRIWVGTEMGGLNMMEADEKSFTCFQYDHKNRSTIGCNSVYALYEDANGKIWIGTSVGLDLFNEESKSFIHYKQNQNISSTFGPVYIIQGSKQNQDSCLWIGTANGLFKFCIRKGTFESFNRFSELSNSIICGIEEKNGFMWISTIKGLIKFNPGSSVLKSYDYLDGLQSNIFNRRSHTSLADGRLVFGGIKGLNIFSPGDIIPNLYKPPIYITRFRVFDKEKILPRVTPNFSEIILSYSDNFFTIDFASLDFTNSSKNQYLYRLQGIDKDWVHLKEGRSASYTNVPPGQYIFEVMGSNSSGVWNREKTGLSIIITPPFWLTAWFKILIGILFVSAIVGFILNIRKKEKKRTQLNKKISELKLQALRARMDPHFIFNTINAIQYLISENDQESAFFYLSKFSKLLRLTLHHSEEAAVSLEQELEMLRLYLEMQKLRFESKFKYSIEIDPKIDTKKIKVPTMIIQPYVENAIEHGLCENNHEGKVSIHIERETDFLVCKIIDDGIGINKSIKKREKNKKEHKSTAMQLTKERLRIINQARKKDIGVSVIDLYDQGVLPGGTQVTIHIPV